MKRLLQVLFLLPMIGLSQSLTQLGQDINSMFQNEYLGQVVTLNADGNIMAVAAPGYSSSTDSLLGRISIYQFDGVQWIQLGQDIIGDVQYSYAGASIDINSAGDRILIGMPGENTTIAMNTPNIDGKVKVYEFSSGSWVQIGQDIFSSLFIGPDHFGHAVSMSNDGDIIAIGSLEGTPIVVYKYDGLNWVQLGSDISYSSTGMGNAIELSGDGSKLAVGHIDLGVVSSAGGINVFEFNGLDWNQIGGEITDNNLPSSSVNFGTFQQTGEGISFNLDGTILAVGVPGLDSSGNFVNIYKYDGSNWSILGSTIYPSTLPVSVNNGMDEGFFGASVSLNSDGTMVSIGQPYLDTQDSINGGGTYGGHITIYEFVNSNWIEKQTGIFGTGLSQLGFSAALSHNGQRLVVGSRLIGWGSSSTGLAQVFALESWNCTSNGCVDPGDGSGTFGSETDCEAMCSCDTYDLWPVSDLNGGPNQNSWCEWCVDYANNGFTNFNATGATWGDPDVMCDCCTFSSITSPDKRTKNLKKVTNLLGQEITIRMNTPMFYIYDDGSVKKKIITE